MCVTIMGTGKGLGLDQHAVLWEQKGYVSEHTTQWEVMCPVGTGPQVLPALLGPLA